MRNIVWDVWQTTHRKAAANAARQQARLTELVWVTQWEWLMAVLVDL